MERLAQHATASIGSQLDHGARAFQLFDSWAGALSRADYDTFVLPHSTAVFSALAASHPDVPGIHFGIGCDHLLESMRRRRRAGARSRLAHIDHRRAQRAWARISSCRATSILRSCWPDTETALAGTDAVLDDNGDHPGHIFNLGHGVQPTTDPAVLQAVVDHVRQRTAR